MIECPTCPSGELVFYSGGNRMFAVRKGTIPPASQSNIPNDYDTKAGLWCDICELWRED